MILGMASNIGVTPDYILHKMTWENLLMYGYATPVYDADDDWDESLDANNPKNFMNKEGKVKNPFI